MPKCGSFESVRSEYPKNTKEKRRDACRQIGQLSSHEVGICILRSAASRMDLPSGISRWRSLRGQTNSAGQDFFPWPKAARLDFSRRCRWVITFFVTKTLKLFELLFSCCILLFIPWGVVGTCGDWVLEIGRSFDRWTPRGIHLA